MIQHDHGLQSQKREEERVTAEAVKSRSEFVAVILAAECHSLQTHLASKIVFMVPEFLNPAVETRED